MKTVSNLDQTKATSPDLFLPQEHKPAIDLKGSVFTLTVLRLQSNDLDAIEKDLSDRIAQGPRFFEDAPIVIDAEILKEQALDIDFSKLTQIMRDLKLVPVGVRHGSQLHQKAAVTAGLALMKGGAIRDLPNTTPSKTPPAKAEKTKQTPTRQSKAKTDKGALREHASAKTKVIDQPIRSGQQIYAQGGDLIVLAAVNAGAEIVADGNIHVYAPLRGRALAGVKGDQHARIFCQNLEAELVSVAGQYRVFEDQVPKQLHKHAVQIYLQDDNLAIDLIS